MRTTELIILGLLFLLVKNIEAQNKYLGIKTGIITQDMFLKYKEGFFTDVTYSLGLNAEYTPIKAMFSVSTELQYPINKSIFLIPISVNFIPGNKIKLRLTGGIVPLIRINRVAPNKSLGIGGRTGLGINIKIKSKLIISSEIGFFFLPEREYHYSHFGTTDIVNIIEKFEYLNIGISYLVNFKND